METISLGYNLDNVYHETLANGLNIYLLPNSKVTNYYITYTTKYGSIHNEYKLDNENEYRKIPDGSAHYLEHLTFKIDGQDAFSFFDQMGCDVNAHTSYEETSYEVIGNNNFNEVLKHLIKFVDTPYYTEETLKNEFGIISEEIKMYQDNPNDAFYHEFYNMLYNKEKYRNNIGGTIDDIKKITLDDIINSYETFYQPNNMFIVITGNFIVDDAIKIIKENSKKISNHDYKIKEVDEPLTVNIKRKNIKGRVNVPKVAIGYKIPINLLDSKERLLFASHLLLNINFGRSSEFTNHLLEDETITSIFYYVNVTNNYITYEFFCETNQVDKYLNEFDKMINNLKIEDEIIKIKQKCFYSNYIRKSDNIVAMNNSLQKDLLVFNRILNDEPEISNSITSFELSKISDYLKNNDNRSILVLEPEGE